MKESLCYLTYTSKMNQEMSEDELKKLVETSQVKNAQSGITGLLISLNNTFIQYLEGEKENVKTLYGTIKNDSRHKNIEIQFEGVLESRIFSNWSMSLENATQSTIKQARDIDSFHGTKMLESFRGADSNLGLRLILYFYELKYKLRTTP
ncbi:MAG TPA: hypothetical protein DCR04_10090 [Flavobacteriales bacterium]|nr:hypothetical protein [Flavobacteriales bacterium]